MKKLLLLMLLPVLVYSQVMVEVTPVISTTVVDSVTITSGSDTLLALNDDLDSASVGLRIIGQGIPFGATIVTIISDSLIEISTNATATTTLGTVSFANFDGVAYSAGDALGFPLTIQPFRKITQIIVEDDSKQITSVDMVFFDSVYTYTGDNIAFAPSDAHAKNLVGYITVGGTGANKALGNNHVLVLPFTTLPLNFTSTATQLYVQMIVVGTPTFTALNNLRVKFIGE